MNDSTIMAYARMAGEDGGRIERLSTDLAACRTRLVALADAYEYTEKATGFGGRYRAYEDARDWLAAHPEGGQDG